MADTITLNSDKTLELSGARDAATGSFLNAATVTYGLYTSAGVLVPSGTGTLTYVAASDGNYRGVIESTVTSTLTTGQAYYALITLVQSAYDFQTRIDFQAVAPGQAVIDPQSWYEATGITVTGVDVTTISRLTGAVSEALTRRCYPKLLVPKTLTLFALDAPAKNVLLLPALPVRSITALYVRYGANGDSSTLEAADLLTAHTDYVLDVDDALTGWSRSGRVFRRGARVWGYESRRDIGRLAGNIDPARKAVFVSAACGPATVSPVAQEVAARIVTQLFNRRKEGAPYSSESWNGRSQSISGPFSAEAAVNSPDVLGLLRDAGLLPGIHVGGS